MINRTSASAMLKRKHVRQSLKYVLKLKNLGDWLLKKDIRPLIEEVIQNGNVLGVNVTFSQRAVARCMAAALRHNSEQKFGLYSRVMMSAYSHAPNDGMEASAGIRISVLIDIVRSCCRDIWWQRALSWIGSRKMRTVLQKSIQSFRVDVVGHMAQKQPERFAHGCVWQWEKGVMAVSEPMSEDVAEVAMCMYRLLETLTVASSGRVESCFVSLARHGSVPLLRKFHAHHTQIPGPLNLLLRAALRRPSVLALMHEWEYVCPNMQNIMLTAAYTNNVDAILYLMDLQDFEPDSSHVAAAIRGHAAAALHVLFCCFENFRTVPKAKVHMWGLLSARHCSVSCMLVLLNHFDAFSTHGTVHALRVNRNTSEIPIPHHMHAEFMQILERIASKLPAPEMKRTYKQLTLGTLIAQSAEKPTCAICLEHICKDTIHMLQCGHMFHSKCVARCHKAQCPECRKSFVFEFE